MENWGDPKYVDVWADDVVTLSLQYSTQWDSLAHVGAEFDADGDGVEEAVYYNGYRAGDDLVGPRPTPRATAAATAASPTISAWSTWPTSGVQGRGVLVDLAHHLGNDWRGVDRKTLEEIMAADNVVVEPGDMLLLHTGFATEVLKWNRDPDPVKIHTLCTYLDARDESLLRVDRRLADLRAGGGQLRGRGPGRARTATRAGTRSSPSTTSACSSSASRSGEMWYLHELADVAARARPEPVPAHRTAAAAARASWAPR